MRVSSVLALIFSVLLVPLCSMAQWTQVSTTNLIGSGPYRNQGAMAYADGVAWAGVREIYNSTDRGSTWTKVASPWNTLPGYLSWICFLDRDHGCVCGENGLLITDDGGATWQQKFWGKTIFCAAYLGTTRDLVVGNQKDATIEVSHDAGSTWKSIRLPNDAFLKDMRLYEPGHVIGFVEFTYAKGNASAVVESTDFGETWKLFSGRIDPDSHSFEVLRCDHSIVLGINEEGGNYANQDGKGEIFRSTDGGQSFTAVYSIGQATLRGSVVATPGMVYTASYYGQMFESPNEGVTWTAASAPTLPIDSHGLIAIDDTTLLAADQYGTIFRRIDLRGAIQVNAPNPGVSPVTLSFDNPLTPCSLPDTLSIDITRSCATADVRSFDIVASGADAASFAASRSGDVILVVFTPDKPGNPQATLELKLTNGRTISIPITATVHASVTASFATTNVFEDTIGATVYVPVRIRTTIPLDDLRFSVGYDTIDLVYAGATFDSLPNDLTASRTTERSSVRLTSVGTDTTNVIWIAFLYYPTRECTSITIDSLTYTTRADGVCGFDTAMIATICAPPDCNQQMLSHYVRYGQLTLADIRFINAERTLLIHSPTEMPDATIRIVSATGEVIYRTSRTIRASSPEQVQLPVMASGAYVADITSGGRHQTFRFEYIR